MKTPWVISKKIIIFAHKKQRSHTMPVFQLNEKLWFPDPHLGEDDGLVAVGGDLSVDRLLLAYSYGYFPWYSFRDNDEPMWFCPLERFVIFPNEIHVSHSMKQLLKNNPYRISVNEAFSKVIQGCARAQDRNQEEGAWLGPDIIKAYTELHRQNLAASVEVWEKPQDNSTNDSTDETCYRNRKGERLVGGLYGVCLGATFFGESMFSLVPNASKLALIFLARLLAKNGGLLIDCQLETPHLRSMGGRYISYEEYLKIVRGGVK